MIWVISMKILRNKKLLILSITAIALLTLTLGVSYAYFTATVTGNDSAVVTKIVAGILDVDFTITDRISNDNILLIKDEKREEKAETLDFTVSNNGRGTLDAVYYVYLTDLNITNNLKSPDFKWELIKNDDTVFTGNFSSAETNTDFTITSETNNGIVIPVKQELSVGQVDRYKLRIWLSEKEEDQNNLLNGSFSGKVRVTSTQLTGSEKYVVFKDQSGTQLGKKIISDGKTNYTMDISSVNLTGSTNIYCNNGGIPTITNNTLNIGGVTDATECKISNDIMDTIANQLTTSNTGIVMTNNQDNITSMNINSSKEVVFDLNGKIINGIDISTDSTIWDEDKCGFRVNNGTLTVNDTVGTGGIYTGKNGRVFYSVENSNITINGGSFRGRQAVCAHQNTNNIVTINGGNFSSAHANTVELSGNNSGSVFTINGGTFDNETASFHTIYLNCSGGGIININGGNFNNQNSKTIVSARGTININDGYFVNGAVSVVSASSTGGVNIYGGTYKCLNNSETTCLAIRNDGSGTLNITQNTSPIYVGNYNTYGTNSAAKTIYNGGSGTININGHIANNCTADEKDTTSGLCLYNQKGRTVLNEDKSTGYININGASIVSRDRYAVGHYSKKTTINNAYLKSFNSFPIFITKNDNVVNPEQSELYICNSTIEGSSDKKDISIHADFIGAVKYYNVTFSNGTTIPGNRVDDPNELLELASACPI